MAVLSTPWKLALRFLSDRLDQEPLPGANFTPAVAAPVVGLTALTNTAPPVARAANWLATAPTRASPAIGKSLAVESAHTNAPCVFALACRPAARLYCPPARLDTPPGTVAPSAEA